MMDDIAWIIIVMIIMVGVAAIMAAVVVAGSRRMDDDRDLPSAAWQVELWNIGCGYQVGMTFMNTCILGRMTLCENVVGAVPPVMDRTISREHCMLIDQDGALVAWNMSAVNPTKLNGYRLNEPRRIMPGDRIELGDSAFLITKVERSEIL